MVFRPLNISGQLYFVTATISGWHKLFEDDHFAQIVISSLSWLVTNERMELFAFVLMPNHVHFICKPLALYNISMIKQNFGSFTAHAILKRLRKENRSNLIAFFQKEASKSNDKTKHKIWKDIQAKNIVTQKFLLQKLEYIHNNPLQIKWRLVVRRSDWKFSSACYYDDGIEAIIPVTDVRSLL